ncbi:MAG TPA: Calx-beta domain-containing protein, partial [Membranihabitans sp.]|nr:Calx-beta domain-containing protein [Membranihabitans sp.]
MCFKFSFISIFLFGMIACAADPDGNPEARDLPVLKVSEITVTEQDIDDTLSVQVTLEGQNNANALVRFAIVAGTATEDLDYAVLTDRRLVFGPGETSKTIQIVIFGDGARENIETFTIQYYNPINLKLDVDKQVTTILDDDDNTFGIEIPSGGYTTPTQYQGYKMVWADEFDSTALNPDYWVHETGNGDGGWGNNELQYYREDNTSIVNGNLVITAKKQKFGGFEYTSSRIKTQGKKTFKFGRVDIRAALPKGKGVWP